jgi:hypothetical protein
MKRQTVGLCIIALAAGMTAHAQNQGKVHELRPSPSTVHRGFYDATLKPVLTIDSGDTVKLWTATGNPRYFERLGVPKDKIPRSYSLRSKALITTSEAIIRSTGQSM